MNIHEQTAQLWKERGITKLNFAESPYTKKELIETTYNPEKHRVRTRSENELVFEIDYKGKNLSKEEARTKIKELQEKNFENLKVQGYEIIYSSHEGKSPYLTNYNHKGLSECNAKEYARLFAEKYLEKLPEGFEYDLSLYDTDHWRPIENQPHYKTEHEGRIHKVIKSCYMNAEKSADPELLEKSKQNYQKEAKVKLPYWELLKKENPTEQERVSCIMKIKETYPTWKTQDIIDFVTKNQAWGDFNPEITNNKIRIVLDKYAGKLNPRKQEQENAYFGITDTNVKAKFELLQCVGYGYQRTTQGYTLNPEIYYKIFLIQFGAGKNKCFYLISKPYEQKALGTNETCIRKLLLNKDEEGKEKLEDISYCYPEKQVLLEIAKEQKISTKVIVDEEKKTTRETTYEELLQRVIDRHKEDEIFYKETPAIAKTKIQK